MARTRMVTLRLPACYPGYSANRGSTAIEKIGFGSSGERDSSSP